MGMFEVGNELGLSKLNGKKFERDVKQDGGINQVLLDKGKGYVQQQLESEYGLNTNNAQKVFDVINKYNVNRAAPAGGVPRAYFTNDAKNEINNAFNNNNNKQQIFAKEVANQKNNAAKGFINDKSYLPSFNEGQGITNYAQNIFGLETDNAKNFAIELRKGDTAAKNYVEGFAPETTEEKVNRKKQAQALVNAEINAVKRDLNITNTNEALEIANMHRLKNENYGNILLENSDYVRERINQGDIDLAEQYVGIIQGIQNQEIKADALNSRGLGILRGGKKYQDNPETPARMAGDRVQDLVGAGTFADVYRDTDMTGVVRKEQPAVVEANAKGGNMLFGNQAEMEADMQLLAAEKGIGPRVEYLERNADGSTVIGMQDVSKNYQSLSEAEKNMTPEQLAGVLIKHNIQLADLGNTPMTLGDYKVRGMEVADRHKNNVHVHKMNNRPIQLDFGMAANSEGGGFQGTTLFTDAGKQAKVIGDRASKAMVAAGLNDEGKILNDAVMLRLNNEDYEGALEAAQAGLDIAKRIKGPIKSTNVLSAPAFYERDGSLSGVSTDKLLGTEDMYSRFS